MTITNIRETRSPSPGIKRQEVRASERQPSIKTLPSGSGAFPRLLRSEDGFAIAIVAVLVFSAFIVLGGLAVEAGFWYAVKRQNQSAANATALAGTLEYASAIETGQSKCPTSGATICPSTAAIAAANSNGFTTTERIYRGLRSIKTPSTRRVTTDEGAILQGV